MKKSLLMMLLAGMVLGACSDKNRHSDNPFLNEYTTPHGVPPFDKITPEHFVPALEEGIKRHNTEVEAIVKNSAEPTFANTIEEFEYSGELFNRVYLTFSNLHQADATPVMDSLANIISPMVTAHNDNILLNKQLFTKVKAIYEKRDALGLTSEQLQLVKKTYETFARGGANLVGEQKERLKAINERIAKLELAFSTNVRADNNAFMLVIDKQEDLAGLPEGTISAAAEAAKEKGMEGKWVFTIDKPSLLPFLQYANNRQLRIQMLDAYTTKGNHDNENDNKANIIEQVSLRAEKAQLLGFPSYAAYAIADKMAKTPDRVNTFLSQMWTPALALGKKEAADMQALINREEKKFTLAAADWSYYADKIRNARYNLNEEELLPYFKLENVLQGAFDVAGKLFGINFTQVANLPLYHPECTTYEVKDTDGSLLGILYFDFHPRSTKDVGAWMTEFRTQHRARDGKDVRPIVSIVCNFTRPTGDKPSLLNIDEVETLFHEFGHGLHGLLSQCTYQSIAGTNVPTDFVELPSQVMENWAVEPVVLKMYARHYQTGEVIGDDLIAKMQKSSKFNQGFATVENIAACMLDMAYHTRTTTEPIADVNAFEKQLLNGIGLIPQIPPRYHSTYFKHIFDLGYTAGYYSYLWSQVLDADAFAAFVESGNVLNPELGKSFRQNILERGNTEDPMELYKKFRGAEPNPQALMQRKGML